MTRTIEIDERAVGEDCELFILSEIGITCNYEIERTKRLIDVAKESGADAVKLMFEFPEELMSNRDYTYEYETADGVKTENMFEMFEDLQFTLDEWKEVKSYASERGVILFCSVDSPSGIKYAEKLDIPAIKISSWDFNDLPLWRNIAQLGKPVLFDTGPVFLDELSRCVRILEDENNGDYIPIHCYHTEEPERMNMMSVSYLSDVFNCPVGFSSPDQNVDRDIMSVALGASVLEKRLTLSREFPQHHHIKSMEPDEFDNYVTRMRDVHSARGSYDIQPSEEDLERRQKYFKQIVADRAIEEGTKLTREMLAAKRPAEGVSPEYIDKFVGMKVNRDIEYNDPLNWDDLS